VGQDAWSTWARAHGAQQQGMRGLAGRTPDSLRAAQEQVLACREPACAAMVHLQSARAAARAHGGGGFLPGDGCSSPTCTKRRTRRHEQTQRRWAAEIAAGTRPIVMRPKTLRSRCTLWEAPREIAAEWAAARLAA
jgi:hypothetical protein